MPNTTVSKKRVCKTCASDLQRHKPSGVPNVYWSGCVQHSTTWQVRYAAHAARRRFQAVGRRQSEAKRRLAELTNPVAKGGKVASENLTVAKAFEGWKETRPVNIKKTTTDRHDDNVRVHVIPRFGRVLCRDITVL